MVPEESTPAMLTHMLASAPCTSQLLTPEHLTTNLEVDCSDHIAVHHLL